MAWSSSSDGSSAASPAPLGCLGSSIAQPDSTASTAQRLGGSIANLGVWVHRDRVGEGEQLRKGVVARTGSSTSLAPLGSSITQPDSAASTAPLRCLGSSIARPGRFAASAAPFRHLGSSSDAPLGRLGTPAAPLGRSAASAALLCRLGSSIARPGRSAVSAAPSTARATQSQLQAFRRHAAQGLRGSAHRELRVYR
eukprot:scaffold47916_cov36-Phaeocystis_antarctica.AAC.1